MRDAVIVGAVRTPVGRRNGGLSSIHPVDLSGHVLTELVARSGLSPWLVDDVIWGCGAQVGDQSYNVARSAVLSAGWPEEIPGVTIDRQCGSSQQAVHFAAAGVLAGQYELAVAGGVESMSRIPLGSSAADGMPFGPRVLERYGRAPHQGEGAQMVADKWGFSFDQLNAFSLASHERAAASQDSGLFTAEIAPVAVRGSDSLISADEGIRRGGTLESMAAVRPAFSENGTITAANSSQISDGAAGLLITTSEFAAKHGLKPWARVHTAVVAAGDPVIMLTAPIQATAKALGRAGLGIQDIGVFEVNEAFASVPLAWMVETGADPSRVNPLGGAIALGHPIGASGARLMTTLVHYMRENGLQYGLQTMCEGGGMANATILELL